MAAKKRTLKLKDATKPPLGLPDRNGHLILGIVDDKILTILYDLDVASDTGYVLVRTEDHTVILNYPQPDIEISESKLPEGIGK